MRAIKKKKCKGRKADWGKNGKFPKEIFAYVLKDVGEASQCEWESM